MATNDRLSTGLITSFYYVKARRQRLRPLFLLAIITLGMGLSPTPAALAIANSQVKADGKAIMTKSAPVLETQPTKQAPAADVASGSRWNTDTSNLFTVDSMTSKAAEKEGLSLPQDKAVKPRELTEKRTENSSTQLNNDGTATQTVYASPHFYKNGSSWQKIDSNLVEDSNVTATNAFGVIGDVVQSWFKGPETFRMTANDWQAHFTPSNSDVGMVRLEKDGQTVSFRPVDATTVVPVVSKDDTGKQTITYKDLWPNIDVEYQIRSNQLKEFVILKSANARSNYGFTVDGATMTADQNNDGAFKLKGALADKFEIAPLSVTLMKRGVISEPVATQTFNNGQLRTRIDSKWLKGLSDENFPVVVDPTFTDTLNGNYEAYKSDGYSCGSSVCYPNAGSINDGTWKNWRAEIRMPYTTLQGKSLKSAVLHLQQMPATSGKYYGTYNTYTYIVSHANCHGYSCIDTSMPRASVSMNTSGNFNVTSIYQTLMARGDWGSWLMINGQEGTTETVKMFNPDATYATFDYYVKPPAPAVVTPSSDQTFTDTQASLKVNKATNPNSSSTPLRYEFKVTTGSDGQTGTIIDSGYVNSTQWTVPDGVLQDGSTYYLTTYSYDPVYEVKSDASAVRSFKIDTRQGKDKTQTSDAVGPVNIDLATGNVATSAASHTTKALGGDLGATLDYNSPVKSRPGLVGEYWNVASGYTGGIPSTNPAMTRVDQAVDFDWDNGSPGGNINNDWYMARWSGYFVAPTAGTYYFGGVHDDNLSIYVDGQQVYTNTICGTGSPCYGTPITLSAGQVATFKAEYREGAILANAHIYVKGAVSEQIVPQKWFQTGVRPAAATHGLVGHFYKDDGGHSIPTDTSTAFLSRTDSLLSFDWGTGSPVPNGATDNFMARWTGYLTVPTTGSYQFGTISDDGSRINVNGQQAYSKWQDSGATEGYGTSINLTAGQSVPITVDYYEHTGGAQLYLKVQGAVDSQVVPSSWLSPKAHVLPDGWNLGIDPDGNASYDHLGASQNSVTLSDSTGSTHEYLWTGTGYKPPVNEDGQLTRNNDGTFTLIDTDGRTYVFSQDGYLQSLTSPSDDKQPAALRYTYSGSPAKVTKITDGVDVNRYAAIYYSGDSHCANAPNGFQANAPPN